MKAMHARSEREIEHLLGTRIRQVRVARKLTMQSAAKSAGISKGFLSKIERGEKAPAISTLINIAAVLNTDLSSLLDSKDEQARVSFVKKSDRTIAVRYASSFGYRYAALAHRIPQKHMQPFIIVFPTNPKRDGQGLRHSGEEFVMALKGKILFTVGEQEFVLEPGDALYFDSNLPHWGRSIARGNSEAIDISFTPSE